MKKIVILISLSLCFLGLQAQNKISTGFTAPAFVYVGGTTSDTLYASDTLVWAIRVNADFAQRFNMRLYIDKVTGTVSDSVYFYGSFDGTTKDAAIDTIKNSNVSDGYKYTTNANWTYFNYPYLLIWNWDKGGARTGVKSVRKLVIEARND